MHELERPLTEVEISCVCCQMCSALEFIHSRNVIHRDVKAGNILLNAEGRAKLGNLCASDNMSSRCKSTEIQGAFKKFVARQS